MPTKIMVTTDFSEIGNSAVDYAFDLAAKVGAKVQLCTIIEREQHESHYFIDYTPLASEKNLKKIKLQARKDLEALVPKKFKNKIKYQIIAESGKLAHDGIFEAIEKHKPDLVVIASNGWSGFQRFLVGSTTDRIVRSAQCPVIVTKGQKKA